MNTMTISGIKLYPLGDTHSKAKFGVMRTLEFSDPKIMAINSHEFRCPNKGEWYLSGATPRAYKAPNNLSTRFYIAKIVRVEKVVEYNITEHLDN